MAGIKDYSTTQANNTSLNGINTAEGMLPSNLENGITIVNGLSMVMVMQLLQQLMQVQLHSQLLVLM
jgi:hypothetical protein